MVERGANQPPHAVVLDGSTLRKANQVQIGSQESFSLAVRKMGMGNVAREILPLVMSEIGN